MSNKDLAKGQTFGFTTKYPGLAKVLKSDVLIAQSFDPKDITSHPTPRNYRAIWDTGATGSCITTTVVKECSLLPIGMANIAIFGGTRRSNVYLISVGLPNHVGFPELKVTEGDILGADMLIGMDIMGKGDLALTNYGGITMFSFRIPSIGSVDLKDHTPGVISHSSSASPQEPAKSVKVGRNQPCPCGSGKKYKKCCGK